MWRQARGAGLQGALPHGMRSGLLCAVCCVLGLVGVPAALTPPTSLPSLPSGPSSPLLSGPWPVPLVDARQFWGLCSWGYLQSEVFPVPGLPPQDSRLVEVSATVPLQLPPSRPPEATHHTPPYLESECPEPASQRWL